MHVNSIECKGCGGTGLVYDLNPNRQAPNAQKTCPKCKGSGHHPSLLGPTTQGSLANESEKFSAFLDKNAIK